MRNCNFLNTFFAISICIFLIDAKAQPDNSVSSSPAPFCYGTTSTAILATFAEPGNDYACLMIQPSASWYYLKVETSGVINLQLSAALPINCIIYGPFSDMNDILANSGNLSNVVGCSNVGTSNATTWIPSANAGEYYLLMISNFSSFQQDITLTQIGGTGSLDCSVLDETFHNISGKTFYDDNQNGTKEVDEFYMANVPVQIDPNSATTYSNANGEFSYNDFTVDSIFYTVGSTMADWTNTTPSQIQFSLDSGINDTTELLFGFFPDSLYYSTSLEIINTLAFCLGTNMTYASVFNNGTLMNGGILAVTLDADLTFSGSSYPEDSVSGSTIYFSFDTLLPFHTLVIDLWSTPDITLTVGDTVVNSANLVVLDSMLNVQNTIAYELASPISCSYDPNNKLSLPNGIFSINNIIEPTNYLEYVINFQNTGTAAAVNVKIQDELSSMLDKSTFEFISSSHTAFVSIDSMGLVTFDFQNINLPDSNANEPLSHGYVKFRIALSSEVMPNDTISNEAKIYFDYNEPITTNSTQNILSCFILQTINLTYFDYQINTNLSLVDYSFVWMLDGTILAGETNNFINCTADGIYTVYVTNQYGCESNNSFPFYASSIESVNLNTATIFPNPTSANFGIYFSQPGNYQINITDESGKLIFSDMIQESNKYIIEGNSIPAGIYFIQIKQDENVSSFYKIVKL